MNEHIVKVLVVRPKLIFEICLLVFNLKISTLYG